MRFVVVGLGIQGNKRAKIVQTHAQDQLVGTVDPVNPAAGFKSLEEVPLGHYDAAFVCTPDQVKFGVLSHLISHGKHLLVEKPLLAPDDRQLSELGAAARAKNVVCYTAYNHRFEPHILRLKSALDSGRIGKPYLARFFYGNGTARDVKLSRWRDQGTGVLPDLGSHLLDLALYLFGKPGAPFERWSFNRFENNAYDHVMFGTRGGPGPVIEPVIEMEATLLSWRNHFSLDVIGEKGSAHINGLCKWGPSQLTLRGRVLPSGKPDQELHTLECADPTWALEHEHFKKLCADGGHGNLDNDQWINRTLNALGSAP